MQRFRGSFFLHAGAGAAGLQDRERDFQKLRVRRRPDSRAEAVVATGYWWWWSTSSTPYYVRARVPRQIILGRIKGNPGLIDCTALIGLRTAGGASILWAGAPRWWWEEASFIPSPSLQAAVVYTTNTVAYYTVCQDIYSLPRVWQEPRLSSSRGARKTECMLRSAAQYSSAACLAFRFNLFESISSSSRQETQTLDRMKQTAMSSRREDHVTNGDYL
jgi:hypothetical protein